MTINERVLTKTVAVFGTNKSIAFVGPRNAPHFVGMEKCTHFFISLKFRNCREAFSVNERFLQFVRSY